MLSQLIYVSVRNAETDDKDIKDILDASIRNNGSLDITGVLLYSNKKFIQCLEGEYDQIKELYDTIKSDVRHRNVIMISLKSIKARSFPSWQMGSKHVDLGSTEFKTKMSEEDQARFEAILKGQEDNDAIKLIEKFI